MSLAHQVAGRKGGKVDKKLNPKKRVMIRYLWREGFSALQIAERFGVSDQTIYNTVKTKSGAH